MTTQHQEALPSMPPSPVLPATVSRRVRGLLAEEHMGQREFALAMGLSKSGVSRRMADEMDFGLGEIERAAQILETSIEYLLGLTNDRSPRRAAAPGGGSMFVLPERNSGLLRACRDSNPKPSDLWLVVRRLVAKVGHLVAGGDRIPAGVDVVAEREEPGAVIIELPLSRIQAGEWPDTIPAPEPSDRAHLTVVS